MAAWYREVGSSERSSSLILNALADPEARTPEEWIQFVYLFHAQLLAFQNGFYLAREGTLDDRISGSLTEVLLGVKSQPGFHRYWHQRRTIFFSEFQQHIDEILSSDRRVPEGVYRNVRPDTLR